MRSLISKLIFPFLLLFLVSCSQGKGSSNVGVKFTIGLSTSGPMMFFARNTSTGKKISKAFTGASDTMTITFPNGTWELAIIQWDGSDNMTGTARCFSTTQTFSGTPVTVDASITAANCADAVWGGASYADATYGLKTTDLHGCSGFPSGLSASSACTGFERSFHHSFKISMMELDETTGLSASVGVESNCLASNEASEEIVSSLLIPVGGPTGLFTYAIRAYESFDCSGSSSINLLSGGLNGTDAQSFASSHQELFFKTTGALANILLYSEAGSPCDYGYYFDPVKLTNGAVTTYLFRGSTDGYSGGVLAYTNTLAANSGSRVLATTVNPSADESIRDLIKVGPKAYFSAFSQASGNKDIFSHDGIAVNNLTGSMVTAGASTGLMTKLVSYGTKIYFGFKNDVSADQKLCQLDTSTDVATCSIDNGLLREIEPVYANATGVYYIGRAIGDNNLYMVFYNSSTNIHTEMDDLSAIGISSIFGTKIVSAAGKDYISLSASPQHALFYISGGVPTLVTTPHFDSSSTISTSLGLAGWSSGVPYLIDGLTYSNIETLSGATFYNGQTGVFGAIGDIIYLQSNLTTSNANIYSFNTTTNVLTALTAKTGLFTYGMATIMGSSFYFIPCYDSAANTTAIWKATGESASEFAVINPSGTGCPSYSRKVGGIIYFSADDGTHGVEPWVTDGSAAGSFMIKDVYPGSTGSYPGFISEFGDYSFFIANGNVYRTKGTEQSTTFHLGFPSALSFFGGEFVWEDRLHLRMASSGLAYNFYIKAQ